MWEMSLVYKYSYYTLHWPLYSVVYTLSTFPIYDTLTIQLKLINLDILTFKIYYNIM